MAYIVVFLSPLLFIPLPNDLGVFVRVGKHLHQRHRRQSFDATFKCVDAIGGTLEDNKLDAIKEVKENANHEAMPERNILGVSLSHFTHIEKVEKTVFCVEMVRREGEGEESCIGTRH